MAPHISLRSASGTTGMLRCCASVGLVLLLGGADRTAEAATATAEAFTDDACTVQATECGVDDVNMPADGTDCPADQVTTRAAETLTFVHGECINAATDPEYDFIPDPKNEHNAAMCQGDPRLCVRSVMMSCSPDGTFWQENFVDEACTDPVSGAQYDQGMADQMTAEFDQIFAPGIMTASVTMFGDLETGIAQSPSCLPLARFRMVNETEFVNYYSTTYGM